VIVSVLGGAVILLPSLGLLFRLALSGRFEAAERAPPSGVVGPLRAVGPGMAVRPAIACLIAGFGLLNIADAGWAHAVGVLCLIGFVLFGFRAIIFTALAGEAPSVNAGTPRRQ
jgi:cytochrome d ubiquinol oxidase subunit II